MNKAQFIADQIAEGVKLADILTQHEFDSSLALGQYMYQQGYRFSPATHRYHFEQGLVNQQLELPLTQVNLRERLSEARLVDALESQLKTIRQLIDGAFPIKLSESTKRQLVAYCDFHHLSVDAFIEAAILDKLLTSER